MIIDAHAHIFPDKIAQKAVSGIGKFYEELHMNCDGTADSLVREGEAAGITGFLVQSVATVPDQVESINNFIAGSVKKFPGKFIGFAALHPDHENIVNEVDRVISMGLKGIKLHPDFQKFRIDDPKAMKIYEIIEGRLPLLIHMGDHRYDYSKPEMLVKVLDRFPNLDIIAAHFGGWSEWDRAAGILGGRRLWVDTSSSLYAMTSEHAKELIDAYGADRVLFGTDYPMWTAEHELRLFNKIPLDEKEREMILHENAEKLLGVL